MDGAGGGTEPLERLMAELRPRLHRYCARMVGSAIDGEDVLQDALAKAVEAYPAALPLERPESWLFRIAHNTALDALRRRRRQPATRSDADLRDPADPGATADARVAVAAGFDALMRLTPSQRASFVLMEVLGHSATEAAAILEVSVASAKAALHRARTGLAVSPGRPPLASAAVPAAERARLRAYADRFNARDFDALRALLAEDVRLDLVNRARLAGRGDVSTYFSRYGTATGWSIAPCLTDGRPGLLITDPAVGGAYPVLLDWADGRITAIRDFRFASYVTDSLAVVAL